MKKSITSLLHLNNSTFSVCPISGIPYTITFPSLGIDFSYKSPFSYHSNLEAISKLPSPELKKLPKVTLAGVVLSLLKYNKLLAEHDIPAFEANSYLQLVSSHSLISAIKFLHNIPSSKIDFLPHFALDSIKDDREFSTNTNLLENYLKACADIINPPVSESVSISNVDIPDLHDNSNKKEKIAKSVSIEDRKALKAAAKEVCEDALCSVKLANVVRLLHEGNTILSIADNMRSKIIERLTPMDTLSSKNIIALLNKYNPKLEDDFMDRVSDDFAIVKAKKTLAEILAERKAK